MTRTFYRIVLDDPPSRTDFLSDQARGKRRPTDSTKRDLYEGLSVYSTLAQAVRKALDFPLLGGYVAELQIPEQGPIRIARTLPGSRGHHTFWGTPEEIHRCVVAVTPVDGGSSE